MSLYSTTSANVLNAVLQNSTYTGPAALYAALYSTAPTGNTTGTELSGSGYARQVVTFATATSNSAGSAAVSNVAVTWGPATADWQPARAVAITDASTSGNIISFQTIAQRNVLNGGSLTIGTGNLSVTLN